MKERSAGKLRLSEKKERSKLEPFFFCGEINFTANECPLVYRVQFSSAGQQKWKKSLIPRTKGMGSSFSLPTLVVLYTDGQNFFCARGGHKGREGKFRPFRTKLLISRRELRSRIWKRRRRRKESPHTVQYRVCQRNTKLHKRPPEEAFTSPSSIVVSTLYTVYRNLEPKDITLPPPPISGPPASQLLGRRRGNQA